MRSWTFSFCALLALVFAAPVWAEDAVESAPEPEAAAEAAPAPEAPARGPVALGPVGHDDQGRQGRIHTVANGDTLWD
ncbi:MAG: hypothetical protein ACR2PQ_08805, partial [Myxococcota bacterium]